MSQLRTKLIANPDGGPVNFVEMPTIAGGEIIESGSNANGWYVKFSNGTLMCGLRLTTAVPINISDTFGGYNSPVSIWTFPHAFKPSTTPIVQATVETGDAQNVNVNTPTNTSAACVFWAVNTDGSATRSAHLFAVGEWDTGA